VPRNGETAHAFAPSFAARPSGGAGLPPPPEAVFLPRAPTDIDDLAGLPFCLAIQLARVAARVSVSGGFAFKSHSVHRQASPSLARPQEPGVVQHQIIPACAHFEGRNGLTFGRNVIFFPRMHFLLGKLAGEYNFSLEFFTGKRLTPTCTHSIFLSWLWKTGRKFP